MPNDYYENKYIRVVKYFEHVSWCGIDDMRILIDTWKAETNASATTWYHRVTDIIALHKWCAAHDETPGKQTILNYYAELRGRGVRGTSVRAIHIRLKAFFDYLYKNDLYIDVMRGIAVPVGEYREKACLTVEETHTLLMRITHIRDKVMVALMVFCGLRCVEVSEMQWGDINGDRMIIRGKGRTDKVTVIVLPISVQRLLRELKQTTPGPTEDEAPVFVSEWRRNHAPLSAMNVSKLVRYILRTKMPEKKGITPHGLRHTAITLAIESGMDIHRVSRFARHKSIATTSVYLHDVEKFTNPVESHIESFVQAQEKSADPTDMIKDALLKLLKS